MSFAIFYEDADLQYIATNLTRSDIPGPDRAEAGKYWNGGMSGWATAPFGQSPYEEVNPNNTQRQIVCTYGTLAGFRALIERIAARFPVEWYLHTLADDMSRNCGGVEPWPVV